MTTQYILGNSLEELKKLPQQSVHSCITSPPYYGLRDYGTGEWVGGDPDCPHMRLTKISKDTATGHKGMYEQGNVVGDAIYKTNCPQCGATRVDAQLGLEETYQEYVDNMVSLFAEVHRVLRDDGTLWLNLGDSYYNYRPGKGQSLNKQTVSNTDQDLPTKCSRRGNKQENLKEKDLMGIPWRVALALQDWGWYLRQDIIWHKPNPMPESVKDRCTKAHEYIFLLTKSPKYYYDNEAIKEKTTGQKWNGKNKRSVWTVSPKPFKGAHFAVFPPDLIEPCVLAGCPEKICIECSQPYIKKPIYEYKSKNKKTKNSHGKYDNQETEAQYRQGIHANRGDKLIEVRTDLPKQKDLISFLRSRTTPKILADNTDIPLTKIEHWFRADENGFAYPSREDWIKVREYIDDWSKDFADIDNALSNYELKTDAVDSKILKGYELEKQCDCQTNKSKSGTVLDPFGGAGTTALVSQKHNRNCILIELNPDYLTIAKNRLGLLA